MVTGLFGAQGPGFLPAVGMTAGSGLVTEDTGLADGDRAFYSQGLDPIASLQDDRLATSLSGHLAISPNQSLFHQSNPVHPQSIKKICVISVICVNQKKPRPKPGHIVR